MIYMHYNDSEKILQRDRKAFQVLTEAALSSSGLVNLCELFINGITDAFEYEVGSVMLYDDQTRMLSVVASVDETNSDEIPIPFSIEDEKYVHSYVARNREAVFIDDIQNDPIHKKSLKGTPLDSLIQAMITIPLVGSKDQLLGTLQLIAFKPKSKADMESEIFKSISELFALAFERTIAEEQLLKFNEELEQRVHERTLELQEVNKELESFSYSVSHDLRTPLRHIASYTELIKRKLQDSSDEKLIQYVQTISDSSFEMNKLIDDVLHFSRISRAEMKKICIDFTQLVSEIVTEIRENDDTSGKITWEIAQLPTLRGDPSLLRIALRNLLCNASKFTQNRPSPQIKIGFIEEYNQNRNVIFIQDNGVGFDMQYYDRLFGVFQRLHGDEYEGTGIGLATVKRIVTKHGGKIWAESAIDKGTTFYFNLSEKSNW